MEVEALPNNWRWWRIAEADWVAPLDPGYAQQYGGRWNPPASFPTLYLNEDIVTARMNLRRFIDGWPYEPEDLRAAAGAVLVAAILPRNQFVCDVHSPSGVAAVRLPASYPRDRHGNLVPHTVCRVVGRTAKVSGLRGVRARSAQGPDGMGRELAWFPATAASKAKQVQIKGFDDWYWG